MLLPIKLFCKQIVRYTHVKAAQQHKSFNNTHDDIAVTIMRQKKMLKSFSQSHYGAKLKVIGSGAPGVPAFIFLLTDLRHYLFNCGEGTQRLTQEHHCKLSKVDNVFITNLSWKNVGGMPGLLLTIQDTGLSTINIHGPEGLIDFIEIAKTFTHYPNLKICYPFNNKCVTYQDNVMTVSYVQITKASQNVEECSADSVNETQYHLNTNGKRFIDVKAEEGNVNDVKKIRGIPEVICYICELHPRPGKLLVNKCIEYGVPPGPLCNELKHGRDIIKEDGTVVFSKDVCLPSSSTTTFIVVECPTKEYVDSIINNPAFIKYQQTSSTNQSKELLCIFHFTPETVFTSHQYQDWIKKFSAETEHVILNDQNTCMGSEAVHKNQQLLHMLHPEIFPLLSTNGIQADKESEDNSIHRAKAIQTLSLRPLAKRLTTSVICNAPQMYIDEVSKLPNFNKVLEDLKKNINKKSTELDLNNIPDYPRIVMLGTGCSVPNKIRNTSGILLRIDEDNSILLDCGEGTLGQITRFYGFSESDNILRSIKGIYVSHMHADHHLGLIGLLLRRRRVTNDPLYLLIPQCITPWLNFYNDRFESISRQYILVNNSNLYLNHHELSEFAENKFYNTLNVKEINTIHVAHCKQSYGIAITLKDNKKIVYSGDTMFSQNLILLGKDCDLLIHEATMESGLETIAKRKLHSTTSEAINVAKFMNAKFTLLTHFSQRYGKIPTLSKHETSVGLAYDFMQVKLPQLPLLCLFYPCLKIMFADNIEFNKNDKSVDVTDSK